LTRPTVSCRKRLIQAHAAEGQRIQKTLEDAGIKLDSVATDVLGASGRAMLAALVAGERDPQVLAELGRVSRMARWCDSGGPWDEQISRTRRGSGCGRCCRRLAGGVAAGVTTAR
jgi:hypothetical protein